MVILVFRRQFWSHILQSCQWSTWKVFLWTKHDSFCGKNIMECLLRKIWFDLIWSLFLHFVHRWSSKISIFISRIFLRIVANLLAKDECSERLYEELVMYKKFKKIPWTLGSKCPKIIKRFWSNAFGSHLKTRLK